VKILRNERLSLDADFEVVAEVVFEVADAAGTRRLFP
jgi:hypothetical protein